MDKDDAKRQVTPDYIVDKVADDWGVPIRSIRVLSIEETSHANS